MLVVETEHNFSLREENMKFFITFALFGIIIFVAVVVDSVSHNKWIPMVVATVAGVCWVVVAVLTYKTRKRLDN